MGRRPRIPGASLRVDAHKKEVIDEYGNAYQLPSRPAKLVAGLTINKVRVIHIPRERSRLYDVELLPGRVSKGRHFHISGKVRCLCLACNKPFEVRNRRLHPNRPELSLWSCGCERRPQGLGWKALRNATERPVARTRGRRPLDLIGQFFGWLEPMEWIPAKGWLCLCHRCGNTDGCLVSDSRQLQVLRVACEACTRELYRRMGYLFNVRIRMAQNRGQSLEELERERK